MGAASINTYFDGDGNIKNAVLEECIKNTERLPSLIEASVSRISQIEDKVRQSVVKAEELQKDADNMTEPRVFHNKDAIITLQGVARQIVDSQISAAEAQRLMFDYQRDLSKITGALYGMGVISLTANRCIIQNLKTSLGKASEEELSEYARKQLLNVIAQLKSNSDILEAQEKINERLDYQAKTVGTHLVEQNKINAAQQKKDLEQDKLISEQQQKDIEHDRLISAQREKGRLHDRLLSAQQQKDIEHDKLISEQQKKDIEHDKLLSEQQKKDIEHDKLISEQHQKDIEHDKLISEQQQKDIEHDRLISEQQQKDIEHDRLISEQQKKDIEHDRILAEMQKKLNVHNELLSDNRAELEGHTAKLKELYKNSDEQLSRNEDLKNAYALLSEKLFKQEQKSAEQEEKLSAQEQGIDLLSDGQKALLEKQRELLQRCQALEQFEQNEKEYDATASAKLNDLSQKSGESIKSLRDEIAMLNQKSEQIDSSLEELKKQTMLKVMCFVSMGVAVVALILAIVGFFL